MKAVSRKKVWNTERINSVVRWKSQIRQYCSVVLWMCMYDLLGGTHLIQQTLVGLILWTNTYHATEDLHEGMVRTLPPANKGHSSVVTALWPHRSKRIQSIMFWHHAIENWFWADRQSTSQLCLHWELGRMIIAEWLCPLDLQTLKKICDKQKNRSVICG